MKCNLIKGFSLLCLLAYFLIFSSSVQADETIPNRVSLDGIFTTNLGVSNNSSEVVDDVGVITNGLPNQVGALWSTEDNLLDFKKDFNMVAYVKQTGVAGAAGDGMVFLLQGATPELKWFTYSGASMGALGENKYKGTLGIPNSIGIEFDLYGNRSSQDGFFDNGISGVYKNSHIAVIYPGMEAGYQDNYVLLGTSTRYVKHDNLITDVDLANGNWNRLDLHWQTNESDFTKGVLAYQINGGTPIIINSEILNAQVFLNGSVSTAYWGFTGSTGPTYKAVQNVVFQRVPGLVDAKVKMNVVNKDGQEFPNGAVLEGNTTYTVNVTADWLDGKQNWQNILLETTLPEGIEIVPDTTTIDGNNISDTLIWSANTLKTSDNQIPPLGNKQENTQTSSTISFKVKTKNDNFTNQNITNRFSGRNAIYNLEPYTFTIKPVTLSATITSPKDQAVIVDNNLTELSIETSWIAKGTASITQAIGYAQGGELQLVTLNQETITNEEGNFSYDMIEAFKKLSYGEFSVEYLLKNENNLSTSSKITLFKQNAPSVSLKETEQSNTFYKGSPIKIPVLVEDKDSSYLDIIMEVEGQSEPYRQTIEHIPGETQEVELNYDTSLLTPGIYTLKIYCMDSEKNKSEILSLDDIYLEGFLAFEKVPQAFSSDALKIGGNPEKVTNIGEIAITDSRVKRDNWLLEAHLVDSNFVNTASGTSKALTASNNFFYYQLDGQITSISTEPVTILRSNPTDTATRITVNQEQANGFYFNPNNAMGIGTYQGKIQWNLISAPT